MKRRREFIAGLGGAMTAAWPSCLSSRSSASSAPPLPDEGQAILRRFCKPFDAQARSW